MMKGHDDQGCVCVAWSPDGKMIASCGNDWLIRLWDSNTGAEQGVLRGHTIWVFSVRFSPDGTRLASAAGAYPGTPNRHAEVKLWDIAARREIRSFQGVRSTRADAVAFSPDGKLLAAADGVGAARIWEVDTGNKFKDFEGGHSQPVIGLAFSRDGRRLATASEDGLVVIWDVSSGIAFDRNGRRLAFAGDDNQMLIVDTADGRTLATLTGETGEVQSIAFAPDGLRIATSGANRTIRIWDPDRGDEVLSLRGHLSDVCGLAWSTDGRCLASVSHDQTARIWDSGPPEYTTIRDRNMVWAIEKDNP